jgi:WD40 repeat protein
MIKLELRGKMFTVDRNILLNVKGTYFTGLLSSGVWQPNCDGVYVIDRPSEGFDRILDCLETGKLDCKGLTDYEIDCVYDNLDYFLIPVIRLWDYSKKINLEDIKLLIRLQLKDGRLCGRTENGRICIYNMDTNITEMTLEEHTDIIYAIIQLEDGRICSSSNDGTFIKLWNIESGRCNLTINGHTDVVNCVIQLIDGRLCSGSYDRTIRVWNKDTGVCERTFNTGDYVCSIAQLRNGKYTQWRHRRLYKSMEYSYRSMRNDS